MQIKFIPVDQIQPDPNQPRSKINEEKVSDMARSMRTKGIGVINPIEVDNNNMIITGETRWRAAMEAGLKEVPCKVIETEDRFLRQVVENIHQGSMTDWDTAKALEKLLKDLSNSHGEIDRDSKHSSERFQKGIVELANKLGKSPSFIHEKLQLLKESATFQIAAQEGKLTARVIRDAATAPKEFQDRIKAKFIKNELPTADSVREIARALHRNPEKAEELLSKDFSGLMSPEVSHEIRKISPSEAQKTQEVLTDYFDSGRELLDGLLKLESKLEEHPFARLSDANRQMIVASMLSLVNNIKRYLGDSFTRALVESES